MDLNRYSVAIPAYGRPKEFEELLASIYTMSRLPDEIIICEDGSPERTELEAIAKIWKPRMEEKNCALLFVENDINLGYDGNVRKLIEIASYKWVILIGNDDLFLANGIVILDKFVRKYPDIAMISRPFLRFTTDVTKPLGLSSIDSKENIYSYKRNISSRMIFRSCGFVGGLVINRDWALQWSTSKYDGSLYYQIYLACIAFCTTGIGYLPEPTVAGRSGNPPLFGAARTESGVHTSGSYSAKGRAKMWYSVLEIAKDIGNVYSVDLLTDLRNELMVRQSFHVFEMNVGVPKNNLKDLKNELKKLNLFDHVFPKFLYQLNMLLGARASFFYKVTRKIMQ